MKLNVKLLGIVLAVAFLGMVATRLITEKNKTTELDRYSATIESVLAQKWEVMQIAETGVAMYVPEQMKHIPTKLDDKAKETLKSYSSYEYVTEPFGLRINYIVAKYDLDPKKYAEQLSMMLKNSGNISGYVYETTDFEMDNIKGVLVEGQGVESGKHMFFKSAIGSDDEKMWEVTVSYLQSSIKLDELAEKIFTSIQFLR